MSIPQTFNAQLLGQTENACNALLELLLTPRGLSEPQWVTLTVTVMSGESVKRGELIDRVAGSLKVARTEAHARLTELSAAQLLCVSDDEDGPVTLTDSGQRLYAEIRAAVTQITRRLWGDLPGEDLTTAGRVLSTVLARANAELAGA